MLYFLNLLSHKRNVSSILQNGSNFIKYEYMSHLKFPYKFGLKIAEYVNKTINIEKLFKFT